MQDNSLSLIANSSSEDQEKKVKFFLKLSFFLKNRKVSPNSIRAWTKNKDSEKAQPLNDFINRFNRVSQWVASKIILTTNLKKRRLVLKKFLAIAAFLRQFANFHTLMAFIAAFNFGSVSRLSETWKGLTKAEESFVSDLKELSSTQNNCRNIRVAMSLAEAPGIPYMALFLKDIFFIEEANKDRKSDKRINWEKMTMIGNVFRNFQQFQYSPKKYLFAPVPFIQQHLLHGMNPFTETELYRFSKLAEPNSEGETLNFDKKVKKFRKNKEKEISQKIHEIKNDIGKKRQDLKGIANDLKDVHELGSIAELQKTMQIENAVADWVSSEKPKKKSFFKKSDKNKKKDK